MRDPAAGPKQNARPKRRRTVRVTEVERPAAWKRWLGATLFVAGGGGFASWGVHDLVTWLRMLADGAETVETASALLGLAPLGFGIAVIGPLLLLTRDDGWQATVAKVTLIAALVLSAAGILLATIGSFGVTAVMRHRGYSVCDVWQGTRMSVTTWAARGRPCPPEE